MYVCLYGIYLLYVGVGDMTKMVYHDMNTLFHSNNIHHDIVIFALHKVFMISTFLIP